MYLWVETTFATVQKWSLRPLLDSPKGGLNIGILLYQQQCSVNKQKNQNKQHLYYLTFCAMFRFFIAADSLCYNEGPR